MSYNQFTISYISTLKDLVGLHEVNAAGEFECNLSDNEIVVLKERFDDIWDESDNAVSIVKNKYDAKIQCGLFGIVDDFDAAVRIGFLMGDRIVLIDFLYDRVLSRKDPGDINRNTLIRTANSLIPLLPLAEKGRVVIIPTPFNWYDKAKDIILEAARNTILTPALMSLLNMLSITKACKLHPYTIAESDNVFNEISERQIDQVRLIGKHTEQYAYEGILGALLSEKLMSHEEFNFLLKVPIEEFFQVVSENEDFYLEYLSALTSGGLMNSQNSINKVRNDFANAVINKNKRIANNVAKFVSVGGGIGSGAIGIIGVISVVSAPLLITGAALGLSASLAALVNYKGTEDGAVISVFRKLQKLEKE